MTSDKLFSQILDVTQKFLCHSRDPDITQRLHKIIITARIMNSASISIIRSNLIISADSSGLSVIRSFIIRMNPVYDKTDGGLNGFHRSTSLLYSTLLTMQ